ncbi:MAG TPA: S1C family serine protease [Streptosporangiaceae bacterium]|nr:S1C family serine protease [Streptosporangiaceae bacterium]
MTTENGPHFHHDDEQMPSERTRAQDEQYFRHGAHAAEDEQYFRNGPQATHPAYAGQAAYAGHSAPSSQAGFGAVPPPPPPPPMWLGDVPAGYAGPAHAAEPGGRHRRLGLTVAAGLTAAALVAGGTAWATAGSGTLTAAQIASQTNPGLVDVISTVGFQHGTAEGTGMVLTPNGEVLTNNHVVAGATAIKVRDIGNGRTYTATVAGYSVTNDVAVLRLAGASGLSTVKVGNPGSAAVGQNVVALGNADGRNTTPSVATGKITGLGASIAAQDQGAGTVEHLTGMIRTDANIQPGDSGGPLVNTKGEVIGMDTAASSANSGGFGTTAASTTTAFAIPINKAMAIARQIDAGQASTTVHIGATAFLGVEIATANGGQFGQNASGVPVAAVVQGTAAAAAGLGNGDAIQSIDGQQIASGSGLQAVMQRHHPGDKVSLTWSDGLGQTHTATVTLTAGPPG